MRNLPVTVRVPIDSTWRAGCTLQLYTDDGGGTIDPAAPLLPVRAEVFPGAVPLEGAGLDRAGYGPAGGVGPPHNKAGGAGFGRAGFGPAGMSDDHAEVAVLVNQGFGDYKFAAEVFDEAGNAQGGALVEISQLVSGDEPDAVTGFAFSSYDDGTDRVTFAL